MQSLIDSSEKGSLVVAEIAHQEDFERLLRTLRIGVRVGFCVFPAREATWQVRRCTERQDINKPIQEITYLATVHGHALDSRPIELLAKLNEWDFWRDVSCLAAEEERSLLAKEVTQKELFHCKPVTVQPMIATARGDLLPERLAKQRVILWLQG
jgi:hypothetical protein